MRRIVIELDDPVDPADKTNIFRELEDILGDLGISVYTIYLEK